MSEYSDAVINLKPALYWRFDETATVLDSSGNGRTGTIVGTPAPTGGHDTLLKESDGASFRFFNSEGRVYIVSAAAINPANIMTILFWVNAISAEQASSDAYLVRKDDDTTGWTITRSSTTNKLRLLIRTSGGLEVVDDTGVVVFDGITHLICVTLNAGTWKVNKDGIQGATGSYVHGGGFANAGDILVGNTFALDRGYIGLLDEFAFFPGVELTAAQIANLYIIGAKPFSGNPIKVPGTMSGINISKGR